MKDSEFEDCDSEFEEDRDTEPCKTHLVLYSPHSEWVHRAIQTYHRVRQVKIGAELSTSGVLIELLVAGLRAEGVDVDRLARQWVDARQGVD